MYARIHMVVSLNYCSQNGGNLYRAPYYNGNPNIGPRIIRNLDQYPHGGKANPWQLYERYSLKPRNPANPVTLSSAHRI